MIWWIFGVALAVDATPITYEEALQSASRNNPLLRRAEASQQSAEGAVQAAGGNFDPLYRLTGEWRGSRNRGFFQGFPFDSLSRNWNVNNNLSGTTKTGTTYGLNLGVDRNYSEFNTDFGLGQLDTQIQDTYTSNINASVTQNLLRGIKTRYNLQNVTMARKQQDLATLVVDQSRQETLLQAAQAYWNWVYQVELRAIAAQSVVVAEEALRVGRLQVDSGQLAPVEGTRLEAAKVQAEQAALDADNAAELAANQLHLLMGTDPGQPIMPATKAGDVPVVELDLQQATDVAMQQNVDLAIAEQNLDISTFDLQNAKHGTLPLLQATVAAGIAAQDGSFGASVTGLLDDDNQPFVAVSGLLEVPIGNRSAKGLARQREGTVVSRQVDLQEQKRSVAADVEQFVRAMASARRRTELADVNPRLATETLAAEEALAAAGRSIQKTVLEARTEVQSSAAEAAKARTDYRLAQAQLMQAQGQLTADLP